MPLLNVHILWHDNQWNGTVCRNPLGDYLYLERVRSTRNLAVEIEYAGKPFGDPRADVLPHCPDESAVFITPRPWVRTVKHQYAENVKARERHGQLEGTKIEVKPFFTFAVPLYWVLRDNQEAVVPCAT